MSAYTPGPWNYTGYGWVQDGNSHPIANFSFSAAKHDNARLIAAAPELLEALKKALYIIEVCDASGHIGMSGSESISTFRAVIDKAEGKQ